MVNNFKDLEIWKKGIELVKDVYKATEGFPDGEFYGLVSQMRRAAVSVPLKGIRLFATPGRQRKGY